MKVLQSNIAIVWMLLGMSGVCLAGQNGEGEAPIELEPYEVEAERIESAADLMEAGVDLVDPAAAGRQASGSLGEALSWQPGVSSSFYGGGASRPVVRGMEGYRVGVYDSGLSTGDLSASSPDHAVAIEPLFVREITLHRGAAALLHGGGAIGGAVDTDPDFLPGEWTPPGWGAVLGAILETVNEGRTAYLKAGHREGPWAVRVNLLDRETEDYEIPGFARTEAYDLSNRIRLPPEVRGQVAPNPEGTVPNTWTRTRVGALGVAWIGESGAMQAAYQRYDSRYGVPLDGHTHGNPFGIPGTTGPSANDGVTIDLRQDRGLAQGQLAIELGPMDRLELKGAWTHFHQTEREGRFLSNDFQLDGADLQMEFGGEWGTSRFFTGLEFVSKDLKNRNISYNAGRADEDFLQTRSRGASLYALLEWELAHALFRFGGRIDRQRASRVDLEGISRTDKAGSGVLELVVPFADAWQGVLSMANTARIPNVDEFYIEAPHGAVGIFQLPNPQLDPERARSAEVRLQRQGERVRFSASAFYRNFDGYVFLENQGYEVDGLTAYALVQRDARFYGCEVEASWTFLNQPGRTGQLRIFGDYVRATDTERGEPLPRIPPVRLGVSIEGTLDRWTAEIRALHAFEQDRVPREVFGTLSYQSPSDAYTLLTIRLERQVVFHNMEMMAGFEVSNLLDQEARQHTSFLKDVAPLPGRSLQLSLRVEF